MFFVHAAVHDVSYYRTSDHLSWSFPIKSTSRNNKEFTFVLSEWSQLPSHSGLSIVRQQTGPKKTERKIELLVRIPCRISILSHTTRSCIFKAVYSTGLFCRRRYQRSGDFKRAFRKIECTFCIVHVSLWRFYCVVYFR